ncbi:hypothetical protein, partial [Methylobacterium sp. WL8]|uniref:hypothetical protein n=1 Tax=Methylobacterium sp. WL8 TaxID=2603899 RepID=UPI001AEF1AE6
SDNEARFDRSGSGSQSSTSAASTQAALNHKPLTSLNMSPDRHLDGERRSLHILHGYQDLNFAHIAYPSPDKNGHIFRTNNLMRLPHVAIGMLTPPEGPTESPDPEIIESIERHFRDND